MSEPQSFPPPGAPPPPGSGGYGKQNDPSGSATSGHWGVRPGVQLDRLQAPGPGGQYQPYPGPAAQPPRGMYGAAHKPGAVPLHPLTLSSIYDAAFRIIRTNPQATVGAAVILASVTMTLPVIVSAISTFVVGATIDASTLEPGTSDSDIFGFAASLISFFGGFALLSVGLMFVTAMVAHVTHEAAIGRRLTIGQAWAATRGKRWKLVGLLLITNAGWLLFLGLWAGLGALLTASTGEVWVAVTYFLGTGMLLVLPAMAWYWTRLFYLPPVALILEPIGVIAAIKRGFHLTKGAFWRTFGIALLTLLVTFIAANIISVPVGLLGQILMLAIPEVAIFTFIVTQALGTVISAAFVTPFLAAVAALQYLDLRMRKEAYDVELLSKAGLLG